MKTAADIMTRIPRAVRQTRAAGSGGEVDGPVQLRRARLPTSCGS